MDNNQPLSEVATSSHAMRINPTHCSILRCQCEYQLDSSTDYKLYKSLSSTYKLGSH